MKVIMTALICVALPRSTRAFATYTNTFTARHTLRFASFITEETDLQDISQKEKDTSIYTLQAEALAQVKSPFLQVMRDRGFIHQCRVKLD